ncbi:MAG: Lysophospholipase L1 [Verrucomicrobia bacterium]|nr:MAG: Lysophospholipase L1 [Verrucomicrobiota bacterium]
MKFLTPLLFAVTASVASAQSAAVKTKVACVGDSITQGVGAPGDKSYPAQLGTLLGEGFEVKNFGNSGSTLLRTGDKPYERQGQYKAMLEMKADVYVIKLGTNDTKPHNWVKREEFKPSGFALVEAIRGVNPAAKIFVCLPVPAFPANFGITDEVIRTGVIPQLKEIAAEKKLGVIDLYTVLQGRPEMVPDKVHPNAAGYTLISEAVRQAIAPVAVGK